MIIMLIFLSLELQPLTIASVFPYPHNKMSVGCSPIKLRITGTAAICIEIYFVTGTEIISVR